MQLVLTANGLVLVFAAILMALDAALFPDTAGVFGLAAMLMLGVGGMLVLVARSRRGSFSHLHAFVMTSSVWLLAAIAGAFPLHLWGLTITDAFFESMSGVTTTGSTVMAGLDQTAHGILFWRALLQWVGGVGFIVTGIAILPLLNVGGMQLTEARARSVAKRNWAARRTSPRQRCGSMPR
jgi:trk system potassium uptake protein TrkH